MQSIEEMYGHFGPDVVKEIKVQIIEQGGMIQLLKRLNLSTPVNPETQHDVLRNFIFQYGVSFFLKALKSNMAADDVERMKVSKLVSQSHQTADAPSRRRSHETEMNRRANDMVHRRRATDRETPFPPPDTRKPSHQAAESVGAVAASSYQGPERRIGKERRGASNDRRKRVDVVFKNRRYGGRERRKNVRRKADREKARKP